MSLLSVLKKMRSPTFFSRSCWLPGTIAPPAPPPRLFEEMPPVPPPVPAPREALVSSGGEEQATSARSVATEAKALRLILGSFQKRQRGVDAVDAADIGLYQPGGTAP